MKRLLVGVAALLTILAAMVVGVAAAAPIEDGQRISREYNDGPIVFSTPPSCTSFPAFPQRADFHPDIQVRIEGWLGPLQLIRDPHLFSQEVWLKGHVLGRTTDTAGNVYNVSGHFSQQGTRVIDGPLAIGFDGEGHLVLTGPGGTYAGKARLSVEIGGATQRSFDFSEMNVCTTRG